MTSSNSRAKRGRPRIAVVVSHPIQHFCPQYASIAKSKLWEFKVFFASTMGADAYHDKDFATTLRWEGLYLDQFPHQFLNNRPLLSDRSLDAPNAALELSTFAPDVVIGYGYWQRFQRRVRRWAKSNNSLIYYISDSEIHCRENRFRRALRSVYLQREFKWIDRALSVGSANEFYYSRHGVATDKITRMNFPIDIALYDAEFKRRDELRMGVRFKLGCDDNTMVLCIVGKLVDWKRQRDAIEAVVLAKKSGVELRLIVLGSGPEESQLRAFARTNGANEVHFAGFVPPEELPSYYAASDAYIHTSLREPHSLAISEAIYMGLPVIVSNTCGSYGPHDDVQPGRNGFVYPFGDVRKLAHAICDIAENPIRRSKFGRASRQYALDAQQRAHGLFLEDALTCDSLL